MLDSLKDLLAQGSAATSVFAYAAVFLGGVMASFTPCTYPVLPFTLGYIGSMSGGRRAGAIAISFAMVTGMAFVYAVMGVCAASLGLRVGAIWGQGWPMFAIASFFLLMGLFLLDVFTFPTPAFLVRLQSDTRKAGKRSALLGAFLFGGVSGLVVGPCTGPILAAVLVAVTATLKEAEGAAHLLAIGDAGFKLFLFGFGQGALILLCGIFAGAAARLPRSGAWLEKLKKVFALATIAAAALLFIFIGQATDFPSLSKLVMGGGAPSGGAVATVPAPASGTGTVAASVPVYGGEDILLPVDGVSGPVDQGGEASAGNPAPDFSLNSLDGKKFTLSKARGKGVVLAFFATWCPGCMEEVPEIKKMAELAKARGVLILGVNGQEARIMERFVADGKLNYRVLLDKDNLVAGRYGVTTIPHILGIDASGVVRYREVELPANVPAFLESLARAPGK